MSEPEVYRTESGTIFRLVKSDEGRPSIELLRSAAWESGPVGMVGLRLARGTVRLTKSQVAALPL